MPVKIIHLILYHKYMGQRYNIIRKNTTHKIRLITKNTTQNNHPTPACVSTYWALTCAYVANNPLRFVDPMPGHYPQRGCL